MRNSLNFYSTVWTSLQNKKCVIPVLSVDKIVEILFFTVATGVDVSVDGNMNENAARVKHGWRKRLARCVSHPWNQAWWAKFHVREFPQLISPVLGGFFSWYSGFPPSLKSTQIGDLRPLVYQYITVTCYPHKIKTLQLLLKYLVVHYISRNNTYITSSISKHCMPQLYRLKKDFVGLTARSLRFVDKTSGRSLLTLWLCCHYIKK